MPYIFRTYPVLNNNSFGNSTSSAYPSLAGQNRETLYRQIKAQCVACHQPNFKGLNEFPRLSRQKYPYLVKQLKDFRDGTRVSDVMGPTVNLTDEQIEALAQSLTSL